MRVLVTGGTGFLGRAVLRQLVSRKVEIGCFLRETASPVDVRMDYPDANLKILTYKPGYADLVGQVTDFSPDFIVHLAAVSRGQEDETGIRSMLEANTLLPSLLAAGAEKCGAQGVVLCGTSWQTSTKENEYVPFNYYAATKQAAEDLLVPFAANGLKVASLRMFDNYGPGDWRNKVIDLIFNAVVAQEPLKMSPGHQKLDLVYVDDAASAVMATLDHLATGQDGHGVQVYGVSSGVQTTLRDIEKMIAEISASNPPIQWGGRDYRPGEIMEPISSLPLVPGWSPQTDLRTGLERVWQTKAASMAAS